MISDRLTELREQINWTQEQVAQFLNVANSTYAGYESGYRQPPLDTVTKLAQFYNKSTDYLLGVSDDPRPPDQIRENLAFFEGEDHLTEEEWDYLKENLKLFRKMKAQQEKNRDR